MVQILWTRLCVACLLGNVQLAHGETSMRTNEHLDSDEELMPSFYDSAPPDSEDDVNDFLPDFEFDTTESYDCLRLVPPLDRT